MSGTHTEAVLNKLTKSELKQLLLKTKTTLVSQVADVSKEVKYVLAKTWNKPKRPETSRNKPKRTKTPPPKKKCETTRNDPKLQKCENLEFFTDFQILIPYAQICHFGPKSIIFLILTKFCMCPILKVLISNLTFVFKNLEPKSKHLGILGQKVSIF